MNTTIFVFLAASMLCGVLFLLSVAVCIAQVKAMFTRPNKNVIQVSIDYRFMPMAGNLLLAIILGSSTWFAVQMVTEQSFMNSEKANRIGHMGSDFIVQRFSAKNGDCSHVSRPDGKPIVIHLDPDSQPSILCGISRRAIESKHTRPFIQIEDEYQILVGSWPFNYTLASSNQ